MSPTSERTSRARIRIRFLDNSVRICETPPRRCRDHPRDRQGRRGVLDRAFNPIWGAKRYLESGPTTKKTAQRHQNRGVKSWLRPAAIASFRRIKEASDTDAWL